MKKILLISDTHGYIDNVIVSHAEKADEIWHAGDIGSLALLASVRFDGTTKRVAWRIGVADSHAECGVCQ